MSLTCRPAGPQGIHTRKASGNIGWLVWNQVVCLTFWLLQGVLDMPEDIWPSGMRVAAAMPYLLLRWWNMRLLNYFSALQMALAKTLSRLGPVLLDLLDLSGDTVVAVLQEISRKTAWPTLWFWNLGEETVSKGRTNSWITARVFFNPWRRRWPSNSFFLPGAKGQANRRFCPVVPLYQLEALLSCHVGIPWNRWIF